MYQCGKCGSQFKRIAFNQHCPKCAYRIIDPNKTKYSNMFFKIWHILTYDGGLSSCLLEIMLFPAIFGGYFLAKRINEFILFYGPENRFITLLIYIFSIIMTIFAVRFIPTIMFNVILITNTHIKEHYRKCPHGIWGGFYQGKCSTCRQNILQAIADCEMEKQRMEEERKEKDRRSEIRKNAISFNLIETSRYKTNQLKELDHLFQLHPREFEHCVINLFNKLGYKAQITPYSNDHGKDGIAHKDGKKYLIECKRYGLNKKPGRPDLQKFYAAICEENADGGYFITTSTFPDTVRNYEYVGSNKIILINGLELVKIINDAYPDNNETYKAMCLACGRINTFSATNIHTKQACVCGNTLEFFDT